MIDELAKPGVYSTANVEAPELSREKQGSISPGG